MSWENILKIGGEEYTRDDRGMITSIKRYMHRYSIDEDFVGGGYDGIAPFDPKERGDKGVYSTDSKEQAQEVADRWNKNNPTKEPYFVEKINGNFYVVKNERQDILKRTPDYEFGDAPRTDTYEKDVQTRLKEINELSSLLKKYESLIDDYGRRVKKILQEDNDKLRKFRKELENFPSKDSRYTEHIDRLLKHLDETIEGISKFDSAHSVDEPPYAVTLFYELLYDGLMDKKREITQQDLYTSQQVSQARGEFP